MGPSGSGKSTLMHCLAGLDTLTAGQVFIGDTDLASLSDRERTILRRDRLGFVFQSFNLLPTLTAEENITLPADLAGRCRRPPLVRDRGRQAQSRGPAAHRPSELSGGQQQRVAVGRALISRPRSSSPTSPPVRSTPRPGRSCSGSSARWSTTWARPS